MAGSWVPAGPGTCPAGPGTCPAGPGTCPAGRPAGPGTCPEGRPAGPGRSGGRPDGRPAAPGRSDGCHMAVTTWSCVVAVYVLMLDESVIVDCLCASQIIFGIISPLEMLFLGVLSEC